MPPKPVPVVSIDIDDVEPHPQNARVHDLESIKASLTRFGQTKPIVVQKATMHVCGGQRDAAGGLDGGPAQLLGRSGPGHWCG